MISGNSFIVISATISGCLWQTSLALAQMDESANTAEAIEADTSPESRSSIRSTTKEKYTSTKQTGVLQELGVSLIFAADLGLLSSFPATKLNDYGPKFGLALEGKALGSILLDKYIIDAGLGWWFYSLTGAEPVSFGESTIIDDMGLKLSGTLVEVSPSYRIKNEIFAGPIVQLRYPSDRGYDSQVERKKVGFIFGAQGGYQIFDSDLNTRFVGRMLLPTNDIDWLGAYFMLGVQVGLPFVQPDILTVEEITTKTQEKTVVEYKKQEFKFKLSRDLVKVILDGLVIFYPDPGFPTITTESQAFLIDFAESLSTSEENWGVLKIESINRDYASAVRSALVSAGISEKKVRIGKQLEGKPGSTPPIEITFVKVKDQTKLQAAIRSAMQAMQIPETCDTQSCN